MRFDVIFVECPKNLKGSLNTENAVISAAISVSKKVKMGLETLTFPLPVGYLNGYPSQLVSYLLRVLL